MATNPRSGVRYKSDKDFTVKDHLTARWVCHYYGPSDPWISTEEGEAIFQVGFNQRDPARTRRRIVAEHNACLGKSDDDLATLGRDSAKDSR
jgi:hypothetical protein